MSISCGWSVLSVLKRKPLVLYNQRKPISKVPVIWNANRSFKGFPSSPIPPKMYITSSITQAACLSRRDGMPPLQSLTQIQAFDEGMKNQISLRSELLSPLPPNLKIIRKPTCEGTRSISYHLTCRCDRSVRLV